MSRRGEIFLVALAGLLLAGLLSIRIGAPWRFVHDDNGAWFGAAATAHLRAGLGRTHGQDFLIRRADGVLAPYLHHPPLLALAIACAYRLSDRSEPMVTRLVPATFHMLGFAGFWVLTCVLRPGARATRVIAAFTYALVPMSSFFGKMPDHEPVGLCFVVWGMVAVAALRARAGSGLRGSSPHLLAGAACLWILAGFTAWAAYVLLLGLWTLLMLERRSHPSRGAVLVLSCVGLGTLALVLAQLAWAGGGPRADQLQAVRHWSGAVVDPRQFLNALVRMLVFHRIYFANVPGVLFLAWLALAVRDELRGRGKPGSPDRLLLAGSAGCACWLLAVARAASIHAYHQFWLLPFVALGAADMAVRGWTALAAHRTLRGAVTAVAVAGLVGACAITLFHRYTRPGDYAVKTSAWIEATYVTRP